LAAKAKHNLQDQLMAFWAYPKSSRKPKIGIPAGTSSYAGVFMRLVIPGAEKTMMISRRFTLQRILPAIGLGGLLVSLAKAEPQPHMHAALGHLRAARQSLERAESDKGGHRVKAMELVDAAIRHVEDGIAYANHR
jgi:hypothetical protein